MAKIKQEALQLFAIRPANSQTRAIMTHPFDDRWRRVLALNHFILTYSERLIRILNDDCLVAPTRNDAPGVFGGHYGD